MKHIWKAFLLLVIVSSCADNISPEVEENELLTLEKTQLLMNQMVGSNSSGELRTPKSTAAYIGDENDTFFGLGELEVQQQLDPLLPQAINTLKDYGWTEAEIISDFGSLDSPEIIETANHAVNLYDNFDLVEIDDQLYIATEPTTSSVEATGTGDKLGECFRDATGIASVMVLLGQSGGNYLSQRAKKKAIKKALKKVVGRTLGWVGVAWAVWDFGDCMGWW